MNGFKKFIETGGKSREEIKKSIEKLLRETVSEVIDNAVKASREEQETLSIQDEVRKKIAEVIEDAKRSYAKPVSPEKIPPRSSQPQMPPSTHSKSTSDFFANNPSGRDMAIYPPEAPDYYTEHDLDMNEKITEMRRLSEFYYNGYLLNRGAEKSLVLQGEFMADVSDDYGRRAFCSICPPIYGAMTNPQLRTFFTWRTDARRGVYNEIDKPYIVLYCCELMNKIGVMSAAEAFGKLLELWEKCREFAGWLDTTMPRWLKDFYVYNDITAQYPDITACVPADVKLSTAVSELSSGNYSHKLNYFIENSAYKLTESIFYNEQTKAMLDGAAEAAFAALDGFFAQRDISLFNLICGKMKRDYTWQPFAGAYVDISRMDGFRPTRISFAERYCIKRGEPALECFAAAPYRRFIGYVLKSVETVLRQRTGFRHKITPNIKTVLDDFSNRDKLCRAVNESEFAQIIPNAVNEWCGKNGIFPPRKERASVAFAEERPPKPPVNVEIDVSKLAQIRAESDEIARKLIVEEAEIDIEEAVAEITERITDESFSDKISEYAEAARQTSAAERDFSSLDNCWQDFAMSLNEQQTEVLGALLNGSAESLCREKYIFPETIYEEINTLSLDFVGDVVIENGEIIADYVKEIRIIAEK